MSQLAPWMDDVVGRSLAAAAGDAATAAGPMQGTAHAISTLDHATALLTATGCPRRGPGSLGSALDDTRSHAARALELLRAGDMPEAMSQVLSAREELVTAAERATPDQFAATMEWDQTAPVVARLVGADDAHAAARLHEVTPGLDHQVLELVTDHGRMPRIPVRDAPPVDDLAALATDAPATAGRVADDVPTEQLQASIRGDAAQLPIGTRTPDLDASEASAIRRRAHGALGHVFAPLADDLHSLVTQLDDMPLATLRRAGPESAVVVDPRPLHVRWGRMRRDVAGDQVLFRPLETAIESRQQLPGIDHIRGLDVVVPVGDYGEPLARAIAEAARIMDSVVIDRLLPAADATNARYADLLADWSFRNDAAQSMIEGIGTYAGATAMLTSRRMPGVTAAELVDRLIDERLFDTLAKGPLGVVGPMTFHGFAPRTALEVRPDGALRLAGELREIVRATRARRAGIFVTLPQTRQTRAGCPIAVRNLTVPGAGGGEVAHEATYLGTLGQDFLRLVRRLLADEAAAAGTVIA